MIIDKAEILKLQNDTSEHCVSLYVRTHRAGQVEADKIRWKNACSKAADKLLSKGLEGREIRSILRPATNLLDDNDFWLKLSDGLCMFLSENTTERLILPVAFENKIFVEENFVTLPLYLYLNDRQRFFIYDISQGHNRFFEANRHSITDVKIEDLVPESIKDIFDFENRSPNLQVHGEGIHHGHGASKDNSDSDIEKYVNLLVSGMQEIFKGENVPLILSGPEEMVSMFKMMNNYTPTINDYVRGNNEHMDPVELHERAWKILNLSFIPDHGVDQAEIEKALSNNEFVSGESNILSSLREKNLAKIIVDKDFMKKDEDEIVQLDKIIRSSQELNSDIVFSDLEKIKQTDGSLAAIKYY